MSIKERYKKESYRCRFTYNVLRNDYEFKNFRFNIRKYSIKIHGPVSLMSINRHNEKPNYIKVTGD